MGIARAFYKQADLIIFYEVTSALDNETVNDVMQAIASFRGELTIIMVANGLLTLKNCTQIVKLGACGMKQTGTCQDIFNQSG